MEALKRQTLEFLNDLDEEENMRYQKQAQNRIPTVTETRHLSLQKNAQRKRGNPIDSLPALDRWSNASSASTASRPNSTASRPSSTLSTSSRPASQNSTTAVGCFKLKCEFMGKTHKWIFPADRAMDVERVRKTVKRKFKIDNFKVKYVDESSDLITVCDSYDLDLAMRNGGVIIM
jgi:hypothetical protein